VSRMCVYLAALLTLGAGCGIPEPIYVKNTAPKINIYYPDSPYVDVLRTGGQHFTICAEDAEGDPIDYYWRINGGKKFDGQEEMTMCFPKGGTTFSLDGSLYPLDDLIDIKAVAEDPYGANVDIIWTVHFKLTTVEFK